VSFDLLLPLNLSTYRKVNGCGKVTAEKGVVTAESYRWMLYAMDNSQLS